MPSLPDTSHTPFRLAEKHFKNRSVKGRLPTLHGQSVIDVSRPIHHEEDEVWQSGWWAPECSDVKRSRKGKERERGERPETDLSGLRRIRLLSGREAWVVADGELDDPATHESTNRCTGCVLIPGYLSAGQQLNLLESALAKYTLPPNPVSIDTHYAVPPNLFDLYASSSAELIKPRCTSNSSTASRQGETRQTIETVPASVQGYEEIVAKNKTWQGDEPSDKLGAKTAEQLTREIRWANLGWVYQVLLPLGPCQVVALTW